MEITKEARDLIEKYGGLLHGNPLHRQVYKDGIYHALTNPHLLAAQGLAISNNKTHQQDEHDQRTTH